MPKVSNKTLTLRKDGRPRMSRCSSLQRNQASVLELAEQGNFEGILHILSNDSIKINQLHIRTEGADTALHLAASLGHTKVVCVLLGIVVKVNDQGYRKRTALHCAAANGHVVASRRLLDAGAEVDALDADGSTPLKLAEENGHADVVLLLARNGAEITQRTITVAILKNNKYLLEICLQKGISVNSLEGGDSLVVLAAKRANWEIVSLLLNRGADPKICKDKRECALVHAARAEAVNAVQLVLQQGAMADSSQVAHALMQAKNREVVHVFLTIVPNHVHSVAGKYALVMAARDGRLETLRALIHAGVHIKSKDNESHIFHHIAARTGHLPYLDKLIKEGADLNAKDAKGKTALEMDRFKNQKECDRILIDAGAEQNLISSFRGNGGFKVANSVSIIPVSRINTQKLSPNREVNRGQKSK